MAISESNPEYAAKTIAKQIKKIALHNPEYGINRISYGKHRSDKFGVFSIFVEYAVVEHDVRKIIEKMVAPPSGFQTTTKEGFYSYTKIGAFGVQIRYMESPSQPAKNIVFDITSQRQATRKPSTQRVANAYIKASSFDIEMSTGMWSDGQKFLKAINKELSAEGLPEVYRVVVDSMKGFNGFELILSWKESYGQVKNTQMCNVIKNYAEKKFPTSLSVQPSKITGRAHYRIYLK